MGKINREELFRILDEQYTNCKARMLLIIEDKIKDLEEYKGDVIDITTEISMGNSLEGGKLFRSVDEDYYDKQKLLSSDSVPEGPENKKSLDKLFWPDLNGNNILDSVKSAPKHKKKYLIKLNDNFTQKQCEEITEQIEQQQFIVYNQDAIKQIITLDVE